MKIKLFLGNKAVQITVIILLYLLSRVTVMLCSETLFRQGEEGYIGTITQGLIEGWAIPPWDFTVVSYNGGSLLAAIFAAPLFLLFGPKMIALTLTSILLHGLGLFFLFLLADRFFNRRVAILASGFFILSPPLFTVRSLIMNGSHSEPAVFSMILFYLFLNLMYCRSSKAGDILLGFFSGMALWYSYLSLVIIITYSVIWLIKDRFFFLRKNYFLYLLSLSSGFACWFFYNINNHFRGLELFRNNVAQIGLINFEKGFAGFLSLIRDGHKIFIFDNFSYGNGYVFDRMYYFIYLASLGMLGFLIAKSFRHAGTIDFNDGMRIERGGCFNYLLIAVFPFFFAICYVLSAHKFENSGCGVVDYRYAVILFPCIFISIAIFVDRLLQERHIVFRFIGFFVLTIMIVLVPLGNAKLFYSLDFKNNYLNLAAVRYDLVGRVAAQRYGQNIALADQFISNLKNNSAVLSAYQGYGRSLSCKLAGPQYFQRHIDLMKSLDMLEDRGKRFWQGIGQGIVASYYSYWHKSSPGVKDLDKFFSEIAGIGLTGVYRDYFYGGVIYELINWHPRKFNFLAIRLYEEINLIPQEYRYLVYLYYGFSSGELIAGKIYGKKFVDLSAQLRGDELKEYYIGRGAGIAHFFSGNLEKTIDFIQYYGAAVGKDLLMGIGLYTCIENKLSGKSENPFVGSMLEPYGIYYNQAAELFKDVPLGE